MNIDVQDTALLPKLQGVIHNDVRMLQRASELTDLDVKLITLLQHDGRMAFSQLAREVGASEHNVSGRVNSFLELGLIEITIVADPRALGFRRGALVGFRTGLEAMDPTLLTELGALPSVAQIAATTGRYQYLAECFFNEMTDLARVAAEIAGVLGPSASMESLPYVAIPFQQVSWEEAYRKDNKRDALAHQDDDAAFRHEVLSLSEADRGIIRELSDDGRMPFRAIARNLEISEAQVRQRFGRLRDAGIARVQAIVDPRTLGFETVAWLGIKLAGGVRSSTVVEKLIAVTGITYVSICLGRFDLFSEIIARDELDLQRIIDSQIRTIEEVDGLEPFLYAGLAYKPIVPLSSS